MKLSDFKDEKGIEVVAKLLVPIGNIAKNPETKKAKNGTYMEFASAILRNNASDAKDMLAILSDVDPAEYHCSAATILIDVLNMLNDHELMMLFGLQSETAPSSGSASETTEGQEK